MRVQTSKGLLQINFRHICPEISSGYVKLSAIKSKTPKGEMMNYRDAGTYCSIELLEQNGDELVRTVVAQAQAILSRSDVKKFNKEIGRKVSLAKTLFLLFPGRSQKLDRQVVWKAYFGRMR